MIEIDKKIFIIAIVMLAVGIMLGRYLFGARGDVSDIKSTVGDLGKQQQGVDDAQQRAARAIDNAQRTSQDIADRIEKLQSGADRSAELLKSNEAIYQEVRRAGKQVAGE